jgi:hypothetical protein
MYFSYASELLPSSNEFLTLAGFETLHGNKE